MRHAYTTIVRQDGFRGLWKGWVPNVQRAALVNMGGKLQVVVVVFFIYYQYCV